MQQPGHEQACLARFERSLRSRLFDCSTAPQRCPYPFQSKVCFAFSRPPKIQSIERVFEHLERKWLMTSSVVCLVGRSSHQARCFSHDVTREHTLNPLLVAIMANCKGHKRVQLASSNLLRSTKRPIEKHVKTPRRARCTMRKLQLTAVCSS